MNQSELKRPFNANHSFPWKCRYCGKKEVELATIVYNAEARHNGVLYSFQIPNLQIPICQSRGGKIFTEDVDQQFNEALQDHLSKQKN